MKNTDLALAAEPGMMKKLWEGFSISKKSRGFRYKKQQKDLDLEGKRLLIQNFIIKGRSVSSIGKFIEDQKGDARAATTNERDVEKVNRL